MVKCPEDYRWSSCKALVDIESDSLITTDSLLAYFYGEQGNYKRFVDDLNAKGCNEIEVHIQESVGER